MPEQGQSVGRLVNLTYPKVPSEVQETFFEQFLDALPNSNISMRIKQVLPKDLNDAVRHAVEFEAYLWAEDQRESTKRINVRSLMRQHKVMSVSTLNNALSQ